MLLARHTVLAQESEVHRIRLAFNTYPKAT